jgi:hypothetical protein
VYDETFQNLFTRLYKTKHCVKTVSNIPERKNMEISMMEQKQKLKQHLLR